MPADVLLVAIDEQSLQQIGRWPWRRTVHADLIERLSTAGVRAIALDIAFTEPDGDDAALAAAVRASGRVVLPVLHEQAAGTGVPVESLPVPELTAAAAGLGHVDVDTDPDGMVRTAYLEAGLGRPAWPGLALAMLRLDPGAATRALPGERDPQAGVPAPYAWVRDRRVLVRFAGPPGHFRRVSYVEVLRGQVAADWLRNAYVFVGPTATGLGDQVPTPVSGLSRPMAGIEFNANVLEALRTGTMMQYLTLSATNVLTGVLVFATCLALASGRRQQMPIALAAIVVTLLVSWALLMWAGRWFTPMPTIAAVLLAYPLAATRWHAQTVASERARAHQALGSLAEGVITADAQGRIDYMNPVAEAWIGAQRLGSRSRIGAAGRRRARPRMAR